MWKLLYTFPIWAALVPVRLALVVIGWAVVPFVDPQNNPVWGNRLEPEAPDWYHRGRPAWLADYLWLAWRNPTNNLRFLIDEPRVPPAAYDINPDTLVRSGAMPAASRWIFAGPFFEFWYLRHVKRYNRFLEVRIGWKFSGVPGFAHTLQVRFGKT
jgi:hypothetical protein